MGQITTEITSSKIASDNPIHKRLLFAYVEATKYLNGNVLELGCGEGRGVEAIASSVQNYTALDKNEFLLNQLSQEYPNFKFIETTFPPCGMLPDNSFDNIITFHVIEHIADDNLFISEIHRMLKPGGKAIISTPNKTLSLARNPWHEREYTANELKDLISKKFSTIETFGVTGSKKVWDYYQLNKKSVEKYTRFDIFNLQYILPASILRIPYDILNRQNRDNMMRTDQKLVSDVELEDYFLTADAEKSLDLYYIVTK